MALAIEVRSVVWNGPEISEGKREDVKPAKPLSLKRNAFWTTLGNGTYAAAQWTQIALIAHLGTSADVGRYALAMAVCAPVFMLFNLQLRQIQATDSTRKNSFAEYLGLRLLSSALALMAVCVLGCFSSGGRAAVALTILVGLFKAIESVSDIYQGLLQQHERMDYVGRSMLLKSALILVAFTGMYYGTHNLIFAVGAIVCAQVAGCLVYDVRASYVTTRGQSAVTWQKVVRTMCQAAFSPVSLRPLVVRALPLGIAMMLISLYGNLPRFVVNKYVGAAGVGVFAAITYISMIGGVLVTAIGTAVAPRLSQYAFSNRRAYHKLLAKLVLFSTVLGVCGIGASLVVGRSLLGLLYGIEYARHSDVLVWTMVAGALSYVSSSFGFGATALGRFVGQPWVVGVATVALLASSVALVPGHGLVGAAIATMISTLTSLVGYMVLVSDKRYEEF